MIDNGDNPDFQKALYLLVEVFGAGDGGVKLVTFRANMNQLYKQAFAGDADSFEIVSRFSKVVKLIDHLSDPTDLG